MNTSSAKLNAPIREYSWRVFVRFRSKSRNSCTWIKPAKYLSLRRDGNWLLWTSGGPLGSREARSIWATSTLWGSPPRNNIAGRRRTGSPGPTSIPSEPRYSCLSGGVTPGRRPSPPKAKSFAAEVRWARQYSPQLLELIDWCLRPTHHGPPAKHLCLAEGPERRPF